MRSSRAFTLVELMVTVAVLAIILSIAVPSFSELIRANRAQTQAGLLLNSFNLARSEAIKRGAEVRVTALSDDDWHLGWRIWVDSNGNNTLDNGELIRVFPAWGGTDTLISTTTPPTTQVVFSAEGRLADLAAGANNNFDYEVEPSDCRYARTITINAVGRATTTPQGC